MTTTTRGRPREFRNAAEKQKAYRERLKLNKREGEAFFSFIETLNSREEALRNSIRYWIEKGRSAVIRIEPRGSHFVFAQIMVDDRFVNTADNLLCEWLIAKGVLIEQKKDWRGTIYQFSDLTGATS